MKIKAVALVLLILGKNVVGGQALPKMFSEQEWSLSSVHPYKPSIKLRPDRQQVVEV